MKIISQNDKEAIKIAVDFLEKNKIISFATDTVYGLAVDASSVEAVDSLYALKQREKSKPIAIFLPDLKTAQEIFEFDEISLKIAKEFLPGALTLVLRKRQNSAIKLAKNLNENDDFLGFRIIKNDFIAKILSEFNRPIAVSSANISGAKNAISCDEVIKNLKNDLAIDGGICQEKIPSTVVKIDNKKLTILREGAIASSAIISSLK